MLLCCRTLHHVSLRQEDAHEYISWLLAAADDEMRAVMSLALDAEPQSPAAQDVSAAEATAAASVSHEADGEWETVGKRSGGGGLVTQVISRSRCDADAQRRPSC